MMRSVPFVDRLASESGRRGIERVERINGRRRGAPSLPNAHEPFSPPWITLDDAHIGKGLIRGQSEKKRHELDLSRGQSSPISIETRRKLHLGRRFLSIWSYFPLISWDRGRGARRPRNGNPK
jgi:hypothetical protein